VKKVQSLHTQISDYQQLGQQITTMQEWIRHTDNTLNARLRDGVYADDVPGEQDVRRQCSILKRFTKILFVFLEIDIGIQSL